MLEACASSTVAESEKNADFAYLQNHYEIQNRAGFKYLFTHANDKKLSQGFWVLKLEGPRDLIHQIPPGRTVLGVWIEYFPTAPRYPYAEYRPFNYDIRISDRGGMYENKNITASERDLFRALNGLTIDAKAGRTYQVVCEIVDGRPYVWIEERGGENDGQIASEKLRGIWTGLFGRWETVDDLPDPYE